MGFGLRAKEDKWTAAAVHHRCSGGVVRNLFVFYFDNASIVDTVETRMDRKSGRSYPPGDKPFGRQFLDITLISVTTGYK